MIFICSMTKAAAVVHHGIRVFDARVAFFLETRREKRKKKEKKNQEGYTQIEQQA